RRSPNGSHPRATYLHSVERTNTPVRRKPWAAAKYSGENFHRAIESMANSQPARLRPVPTAPPHCLTGRRLPPKQGEDLAAYEAGIRVRREEHVRRSYLLGLPRPSHWGVLAEFGHILLPLSYDIQGCPHGSRCHAVHADSTVDEALREGLRE